MSEPPESRGAPPASRIRRELLVVGAFGLATLMVPLGWTELYPFSNPSIFSDAPRVFCTYLIVDPLGRRLPASTFGLARRYFGADGFHVGRPGPHRGAIASPPTANLFGAVAAPEVVRAAVAHGLRARPELAWVEVTQLVWGATDASRVGLVTTRSWRVANPHRPEPR